MKLMTAGPVAAERAVELIRDNDTLAITGAGGGILEPDLLIASLGARYLQTGHPQGLTLLHSAGLGDRHSRGLAPLAQEGLVKCVIGGHFGQCPPIAEMIAANKIEAYNVPLGISSQLFRAAASSSPGLITRIGIGTFIDPRLQGGRMNAISNGEIVRVVEFQGEEYLFYPAIPIDVSFVRGTFSDPNCNISMDHETSYLDSFEIAAATRASGGRTIAQVKQIVAPGSLPAKSIHIPGIFIDALVEHPSQEQTYRSSYDAALASQVRVDLDRTYDDDASCRSVIARRAALEIQRGDIINLGVGIPDRIASVLMEEGVDQEVTLTVEHGVIGGTTETGATFGATRNASSIVKMSDMIDFYHSGGLNKAFVGFAQFDATGKVNVSQYGQTATGAGGFIDITQGAEVVVLCGTLTAGGGSCAYDHGRLVEVKSGSITKAVQAVDQVTFDGRKAAALGHQILIVTERAVFRITSEGVVLEEIFPGVDVDRDILQCMDFVPMRRSKLRVLPEYVADTTSLGLFTGDGSQTGALGELTGTEYTRKQAYRGSDAE